MYDLSIIIPAFNEEKRIGSTLISFNNYLKQKHYNYELIVADDGSTDGTVKLVTSLQKEIPALKLVKCAKNKGKGQAVRLGMLSAKGEIRLFSDAYGSTSIKE